MIESRPNAETPYSYQPYTAAWTEYNEFTERIKGDVESLIESIEGVKFCIPDDINEILKYSAEDNDPSKNMLTEGFAVTRIVEEDNYGRKFSHIYFPTTSIQEGLYEKVSIAVNETDDSISKIFYEQVNENNMRTKSASFLFENGKVSESIRSSEINDLVEKKEVLRNKLYISDELNKSVLPAVFETARTQKTAQNIYTKSSNKSFPLGDAPDSRDLRILNDRLKMVHADTLRELSSLILNETCDTDVDSLRFIIPIENTAPPLFVEGELAPYINLNEEPYNRRLKTLREKLFGRKPILEAAVVVDAVIAYGNGNPSRDEDLEKTDNQYLRVLTKLANSSKPLRKHNFKDFISEPEHLLNTYNAIKLAIKHKV